MLTVLHYYCIFCANTNSKILVESTEPMKLAGRRSSCATIIRTSEDAQKKRTSHYIKNCFSSIRLSSHLFLAPLVTSSLKRTKTQLKWIWMQLGEMRCTLCLHERSETDMRPFSSVTTIIFGGIFLSLRALCVSRECCNWFCWLDSIHTIIISMLFCSLQVAENWMEFLMDFYCRNRCVAKAKHGVPLGRCVH